MLALLTEAVLSMARADIKPKPSIRTVKGVKTSVKSRPSTKTINESLSHLTATVVRRKGGVKEVLYSNWELLSMEIFEAIGTRLYRKTHPIASI